jgi:5-methylcytosine-specific restriction endonuclease McrA
MPRSKGRTGRPWRRARAAVLAASNTCWRCGHRIDLTLPAGHPYAATVDHVIRLVDGGAPLDPANLRPAHNRCNARAGASKHHTTAKPDATTSRTW